MSFFQWMPWIKTLRHLTGIIIIVVIAGAIYFKFFKSGTQKTVFKGDVKNVNIIQNRKRIFIPFIEGYAGLETNQDKMNAGIRSGLRFEF